MTWLVTGGAGYIGSHVVRAFAADGIPAVVLDDLSSGHRDFVDDGVPFYEGNVVDAGAAGPAASTEHEIVGVVHLAGFKYAGVSVSRPLHTYTQNVTGMVTLLEAMAAHDVDRFVFSSSAAVYGTPDTGVVTEAHPDAAGVAVRGVQARSGEWLLADQAKRATEQLQHTSLRYFNVVGSGYPDLRDTSPHNLFPLVFERSWPARCPTSTATTTPPRTAPASATTCTCPIWPSPTSPRPRRCWPGGALEPVYNLGSGTGLSVRQIMDAVARVDRHRLHAGDPAAATRRPGPDRGHRRAGGARPGLADAAHRRRDGRLGLGGAPGRDRRCLTAAYRTISPDSAAEQV